MGNRELELLEEIERLREFHASGDYLTVVILSPQLIVQIIDQLASYNEEWVERKVTSKFTEDERQVYKLAGQLQKKESDRSYIVGALVELFDSGHWETKSSRKEFIKCFTKLDDLVSLRNLYAHEYFIKKVSSSRAKNCSKSGVQLAELFAGKLELTEKNA